MSKHNNRMKSIGTFNHFCKQIPKSTINNLGKDPRFQRHINKICKETNAAIDAQVINGVEFGIEDTLRYFLIEYYNRQYAYGLDSMPTSFNVMEAFYTHPPETPCLLLRNEKDYICSMPEFINYITGPKSSIKIGDVLNYMEEGVIYSYSLCNNIEDYIFSTDQDNEFGVSGISMIRHDSEINMIILAGEKTDLSKKTKELDYLEDGGSSTGRKNIKPDPTLKREAVALEDKSDFWKTLVMTRFDLSDTTQNIRYVMKDCGNGYDVITDDVDVFYEKPDELIDNIDELMKTFMSQLNKYESLFELCKSALMLPSYFFFYNNRLKTETHQTKLFRRLKKDGWPTKKKLLTKKERIFERTVYVLHRDVAKMPNTLSYTGPEIKIESTGYWKRLPVSKVGKDKNGNEIHGRTWVTKNLSWVEKEASPTIITGSSAKSEYIPDGPNKGYIYVMCSASDKEDIFKVGLTTRTPEIRAKEITRGTGVPTKYLVLQKWEVADCVLAEKLIHEELREYRVNNKREFFNAELSFIREVIENNISAVNRSLLDKETEEDI